MRYVFLLLAFTGLVAAQDPVLVSDELRSEERIGGITDPTDDGEDCYDHIQDAISRRSEVVASEAICKSAGTGQDQMDRLRHADIL